MTLPTFLILGVAKAGTTSLHAYLQQHPQVFMSALKDPHFFSYGEQEEAWFDGPVHRRSGPAVTTLSAYEALFAAGADKPARGEASSSNFSRRACQRIKHYMPDAKLILVFRQPAERAYSQFLHARRIGAEPVADFVTAVREEEQGKRANWWPFLCYKQESYYFERLSAFVQDFPSAQLRVYLYDDLCQTPLAVMQDMFCFLAVEERFAPDMVIRHNEARLPRTPLLGRLLWDAHPVKRILKPLLPPLWRQQMTQIAQRIGGVKPERLEPTVWAQLTAQYHEDIVRVATLIKRDLTYWFTA